MAYVHSGTAPFSDGAYSSNMPLASIETVLATVWVSGVVYRWHRREPELTIELGGSRRRRRPSADRHDVAVELPSPNHVREHSGGTQMTNQVAIVPDAEAELRWRTWQARGAEGDRRTAKTMRGLTLLIAAGLLVWFVVQLA